MGKYRLMVKHTLYITQDVFADTAGEAKDDFLAAFSGEIPDFTRKHFKTTVISVDDLDKEGPLL